VLIVKRGMPPAIGTVQMAWRRHDVRAHHRAERAARRAVVTVRILDWISTQAVGLRAVLAQLSARHDRIDATPDVKLPVPTTEDADV
jgi:hypothetical protein